MANLKELIAQRAAIDEKIKELSETQRTSAITQVRVLMEENGLSLADIGSAGKKDSKRASKPRSGAGKSVAAKYRDKAGNQWSGRGLKPRWLSAAIADGKTLEDFAV